MKKIGLFIIVFVCSQWSLYAQTVFGDAVFTKVGIGATPTGTTALLEVSGTNPHIILRGTPTYLQIAVPSAAGNFAPYSKPGDVVFRPMIGVNGHAGLIFNMPSIAGDGSNYIRFGDEKNGGWFCLYNNKIASIDGKVGIGTTAPAYPLEVNGNIKSNYLYLASGLSSYSTNNLYLQTNGTTRMTILNSNGYVGIGTTAPAYPLEVNGNIKSNYLYLASGLSSYSTNNLYLQTNGTTRMSILNSNGNVGIGTTNPQNKLDVNGTIRAKEVKVETGWADFVFAEDYKLPTIAEVKNHIDENKHLPGIPTEAEVKENGVNLGEMQAKLLQKIEELTLYVIQQQETIDKLNVKVEKMENEKK